MNLPKFPTTIMLILTGVLALMPVLTTGAEELPPAPAVNEKAALPAKFDLRDQGYVTPIREQSGGTCWTHGTMAAIESNLLISGAWKAAGFTDLPNLAEYHLDWWNGFNRSHNEDVSDPSQGGLKVHNGGDYRVVAAYISRGDGVVFSPDANDGTSLDRPWYSKAPQRLDRRYLRLYVRDIEWLVLGEGLENIEAIKRRIMTEGAVATAYCVSKKFLSKDFVHYQPADSPKDPNHSVAIVGWDDDKITTDESKRPPGPGAWLIKNSWGARQGEQGYYWISYYDKHCGRHPEMGAVSFRNIERLAYDHIYLHDYHGWRGTLKDVAKAFNFFTAADNHPLRAVSFYTAADNVAYTVKIFSSFEDGQLLDECASASGFVAHTGFHTIDLETPVAVKKGEKFYLYLELSAGGHAIDRTSDIPVLLGGQPKAAPKKHRWPIVISKAQPGESYFHDGTAWQDLYEYDLDDPEWATFDRTANFCMKALAVRPAAVVAELADPGRGSRWSEATSSLPRRRVVSSYR